MKSRITSALFGLFFAIMLTRFILIGKSYRDDINKLKSAETVILRLQDESTHDGKNFTYLASAESHFELRSIFRGKMSCEEYLIIPELLQFELLAWLTFYWALAYFGIRNDRVARFNMSSGSPIMQASAKNEQ